MRTGRFGPYVSLGEPTDEEPKPKRASLAKEMLMDTVTLEQALKLLELPRTLGKHTDGNDIIAALGRFGPYLKCGDVNISLPPNPEDHPANITLERAIQICTEGVEKKRILMTPLAVLGKDTETKNEIIIKTGQYGPYVTDGKTNVTVPKDTDPLTVTLEQAIAMLIKTRLPQESLGQAEEKSDADIAE